MMELCDVFSPVRLIALKANQFKANIRKKPARYIPRKIETHGKAPDYSHCDVRCSTYMYLSKWVHFRECSPGLHIYVCALIVVDVVV